MSTISIGLNNSYPYSLDVNLYASNSAPGRVVCDFYGPTGLIGSFELGIGQTTFVPSTTVSGLSPSTSYGFSAILYGKTSGNLLASFGTSYSTDVAPPPSFPFFPPSFPFFPPSFPFFPPFFPFFPPFFPPTFVPGPSFSDQTLSTTSVVEGAAYSDGVTATNTNSYAVHTGALPAGISLNTSTGAITGTPNQGTAGVYNFVIRATGGGGTADTGTLTLTVIDDGGKVKVFNSATSQWVEAPVFVFNSATSQWVQSDVHVYNSSTGTWQKSQ